jgi:hypothetical protein
MLIDIIIAGVMLLYIIFGAKKGFEKMFLEFFVFVLAMAVSIVFYKATSNTLMTLGIFLVLSVIVSACLRFYFRTQDEANGGGFQIGSKLGGAVLGIVWAVIFVIAFLMAVKVLPVSLPYAAEISNMVSESYVYKNFSKPILDKFSPLAKIEYLSKAFNDKESMSKVKSSPEFKAILENEKIKAIIEDKVLLQYIKDKNYTKLATDPKIIAFLQDGKILEDFMSLDFKKIIERDD